MKDDFTGTVYSQSKEGSSDEPGILDPIEVGRWNFNAAQMCVTEDLLGSCLAPDLVNFGRNIALKRGAEVLEGRRGNYLSLDGYYFPEELPEPWEPTVEWGRSAVSVGTTSPNEHGEQFTIWDDRPVLRTDQSYSVCAWVKLDKIDRHQAIVSQDGASNGGFSLYYANSNGGEWRFKVPATSTSTNDAQSTVAATPAVGANMNWVQLVGVFDAEKRELRLYVNGDKVSTVGMNSAWQPWQAHGPLAVGRWKSQGQYADFLFGGLDDLSVFQGVMTDARVSSLYASQAPIGD